MPITGLHLMMLFCFHLFFMALVLQIYWGDPRRKWQFQIPLKNFIGENQMKRELYMSTVVMALFNPLQTMAETDASLSGWSYGLLYDDYKINDLLDADTYSNGKQEVGDVEDVIVTKQGEINTLVVRTGGFLGMGVKYFDIPFKQAKFDADKKQVMLDKSRDEIKKLNLRKEAEAPEEGLWSIKKLIDKQANMEGQKLFGEIDDLLWDRQKQSLSAIIIEPRGIEAKKIALPWEGGYIFNKATEKYVYLPFPPEEVSALANFELPSDSKDRAPTIDTLPPQDKPLERTEPQGSLMPAQDVPGREGLEDNKPPATGETYQ